MALISRAIVVTVLLSSCPAGLAQQFPTKPIRVVVGGSPDAVPRILGQKFADDWGQQIIADQRPGAGGTISAEIVARSAPDGYTLLLCTSTHMMSVNFFRVSFDMVTDFAPVSLIASTSFVLAVHPSLPVHSVKALVGLAKQRPGVINFASGGNGSPAHLIGEMFRVETGTNMVHVPYKTVPQAVSDLVAGQVHMMFAVSTAAVPQIRAGRLRGLAVTSLTRTPAVPELATMDEAGIPKFEATAWYGFLAPSGTPATVISQLHLGVVKALKSPEVVQRLSNLGLEPIGSSPQEFGDFVRAELAKWAKYSRMSGAKVE